MPRSTWRDEVMGASGMNVVVGVWLMLSPLLLGYRAEGAFWNGLLTGALITVVALLRVSRGVRDTWLSWINLALGVWVFAHGLILASATAASVNEMVTGVLVVMLAILSISATESAARGEGTRTRS